LAYLFAMFRSWATYLIIGVNVLMFLVELAFGADLMAPTSDVLITLGGSFPPLTLAGEPWRLVSSMFLHAGLVHIALNMVCLYQGRLVESFFGPAGFLTLYLVAGLVGSTASLLRGGDPTVSIGASGAVFGVFGAFAVIVWRARHRLERSIFSEQMWSLGRFFALNLVIGLMIPQIDMLAHLGGIVGGAACAAVLPPRQERRGPGRAVLVAVVGSGLVAGIVALLPPPVDTFSLWNRIAHTQANTQETYQENWKRYQRGELDAPSMQRVIETEILPQIRATRAAIEATSDLPERYRPAMRAAVAYFSADEELMMLLARALGRATEAETEADMAGYAALEARLIAAAETVRREFSKLSQ